nr:glycosyltransferase [Chromobacterium sp. ASV5]
MKKNKILFISPFILDGEYGGSMGSRSKLDLLSNYFDVTSLSFPRSQDRNKAYSVDIEIAGTQSKLHTAISNIFLLSGRLTASSMKKVKKIVSSKEFDCVFLDTSYYGWIAKFCHKIGMPCVAMIHNVEFDFELSRLKMGQLHYLPSFASAVMNEFLTLRHADAVITLHSADSKRLETLYGQPAKFSWPVLMRDSLSSIAQHPPSNSNKKNILFVGTSFYGNMEAVLFYVKEVIPLISNELNFEFQIIGRGFENFKEIENYHSSIKVYGKVDDVASFYANAHMVVAPIFSGAGMKVKIAEAMMYGKPVVASEFALIGYEGSIDEDNLVVCKTSEDFVIQSERLIRSGNGYSAKNREEFLLKYSYSAEHEYLDKISSYINSIAT